MENKKKILVIDEDYAYLKPLEQELIRRYGDSAEIQIITEPEYREQFFMEHQEADLLIVDQGSYGDYLEEHDFGQILLLTPEVDLGRLFPNHIQPMMKYLPYEEIMQQIQNMLEPETEEAEVPVQKPDTKIIAIYSPMGGCGKSMTAWAIARKLKKLDFSSLLVGCDSLQSFSAYLEDERFADETLVEKLREPDEELYWSILQNVVQDEVSCLLPFKTALPLLGVGSEELITLIKTLKEKKDFNYLILDVGTELNQTTLDVLGESDLIVMIMENNDISNQKMRKLQLNLSMLPPKECIMIGNQYNTDGNHSPNQSFFGTIAKYPDVEKAMEDPIFYRIALEI